MKENEEERLEDELDAQAENNDIVIDQDADIGEGYVDINVDQVETQERPDELDIKRKESDLSNAGRPMSVGSRGSRLMTPDRVSLKSELSEKHVQFIDDELNSKEINETGEGIIKEEKLLKKRPSSARIILEANDTIAESGDNQHELNEEQVNNKKVSKRKKSKRNIRLQNIIEFLLIYL